MTPERHGFEPHMLVTSRALRDISQEPRTQRNARGDKEWAMVRHGVCMRATDWDPLGPDDRYRAFVHASALMSRSGPQHFSHQSAASIWGLPIADPWPRKVHVLVADSSKSSRSGVVIRRESDGTPYLEHRGLRVTPVARTVLDLTRDAGFLNGLVATDHALRHGLCTKDQLLEELRLIPPGTPGRGDCRNLIDVADPASESPGESLSRGQMFLLRFPQPRLQVAFHDDRG